MKYRKRISTTVKRMAPEPAVFVVEFDHLVLIVSDVERSLLWYMGTLGLEGVRVDEWRSGTAFFPSVRVNVATIIDLVEGTPSAEGRNVDHICLVIDPIDLDGLAESGKFAVASGPTDGLFGARGYAKSLYVYDPDHNTIELRCYR